MCALAPPANDVFSFLLKSESIIDLLGKHVVFLANVCPLKKSGRFRSEPWREDADLGVYDVSGDGPVFCSAVEMMEDFLWSAWASMSSAVIRICTWTRHCFVMRTRWILLGLSCLQYGQIRSRSCLATVYSSHAEATKERWKALHFNISATCGSWFNTALGLSTGLLSLQSAFPEKLGVI